MKITIKFYGGTELQIKNITTLLYNKLIKIIDIKDILLKKEKCLKIFTNKNSEDIDLNILIYGKDINFNGNEEDYDMVLNGDLHPEETIIMNVLIKLSNLKVIKAFDI